MKKNVLEGYISIFEQIKITLEKIAKNKIILNKPKSNTSKNYLSIEFNEILYKKFLKL